MLRLLVLALFSGAVGVLAGCPSYTNIPEADRAAIDTAREGELLWLAQSLYVGQFYDDDRYELVYPRRFDQLDYLRTVEGDAIPPPPSRGVVPAGTRVRIERIEWPTGEAVFARPIYTPRYTTWVFLRVAADRGQTNLERPKRHILLMPGGIPDAETFGQWFGAFLTEDDPNPWLDALPPDVQAGVLEKHPVIGMDYQTLTAAMGYPDRLTRDTSEGGGVTLEVAVYGAASVLLRDGVVVKVSDPARGVEEAAPASAHEPQAPPPVEAPTSTEGEVPTPAPAP